MLVRIIQMDNIVFTNGPIAISPRKYADVCKAVSGLRGKTPDLEQEMKYILAKCHNDAWQGYTSCSVNITRLNESIATDICVMLEEEGFTVRLNLISGKIYIRWDDGNWDYLDRGY